MLAKDSRTDPAPLDDIDPSIAELTRDGRRSGTRVAEATQAVQLLYLLGGGAVACAIARIFIHDVTGGDRLLLLSMGVALVAFLFLMKRYGDF